MTTDIYYEWIVSKTGSSSETCRYTNLLRYLFSRDFDYILYDDQNRCGDAMYLREQFLDEYGYSKWDLIGLGKPKVLEIMVSLSIRMEDTMYDVSYGDRTGIWFWGMIQSLGLLYMYDDHYDEEFVEDTINNFLARKYAVNGHGGLFTLDNESTDLRTVDIWTQSCWYLDSLLY